MPDDERDDVVQFGGSGRHGRRWTWILAVLLAVAAVVTVALRGAGGTRGAAAPTPTPSGQQSATAAPEPADEPATARPTAPQVTRVGHPILGITAPWNLFVRTDSGVVRVEFAAGRVVATPGPGLGSSGPVSFIAGPDWALVRPLDQVPGYVVPDGEPAHPDAHRLDAGGQAFPGPDGSHVWMADEHGFRLVSLDGRPVGPSIAMSRRLVFAARSDGAGNLVTSGPGGVYSASSHGVRRISGGRLLAAGPTRWLIGACADQQCRPVVINRRTGARRRLPTVPDEATLPTSGVVSPDGSTAALVEGGPAGPTVHLLDLTATGHDRRLTQVRHVGPDTALAWSPDGRWLFVASGGHLHVIKAATGAEYHLPVTIAAADQLAIREP